MIRYALRCSKGHEFEAWFASSAAYDAQHKKGVVHCPNCANTKVEKAIMAPGITKGSNRNLPERARSRTSPDAPAPHASVPGLPAEARALLRQLREEVVSKADYVGPRFAEEARKIHYEEAEQRGVWGEASREEARALLEEGVSILPLPKLPEDEN